MRENHRVLISRVFTGLLGLIHILAFGSLAMQIRLLIGNQGLLPLNEFLPRLKTVGLTPWHFPTLFWWGASDHTLVAGCIFGMGLGLALILQSILAPRHSVLRISLVAALGVLYLSYATACRDFCNFQWDALLMESTFLTLFLSLEAPDKAIIFLFQWLLFRVYFESGFSKIGPGSRGWTDLSAMITYYETAPLPTWIGWYAHQLPVAFQKFSAIATLFIELIVPFFIFGSRIFKRMAFVVFLGFQIIITATANYGFFNYLVLALSVFLLEDGDIQWVLFNSLSRGTWERIEGEGSPDTHVRRGRFRIFAAIIVAMSLIEWGGSFIGPGSALEGWANLAGLWEPFRIVNVYHLFGSMTFNRYEVEIQGTEDGIVWIPYQWHYKPSDIMTRPPIVAPHQPRVDFLAWFLTLGGDPGGRVYLVHLLQRLCTEPNTVASLFTNRPFEGRPPKALRLAFYQYHFTTWRERRATGAWWTRQLMGYNEQIVQCASL